MSAVLGKGRPTVMPLLSGDRTTTSLHQMDGPTTARKAIDRRTVVLSALFSLCSLTGCSTSSPKGGFFGLQTKRVMYLKPRHAPSLEVNVSAWAAGASAANVSSAKARINAGLGPWSEHVVDQFSNALIGALREHRFDIDTVPENTPLYGVSIRSYLTAGFVYKTYTSPTFAPFVQVVLGASGSGGAFYQQLYVATDRPFNFFMSTLPASTSYQLRDIDALQSESGTALEALALLATQLGRKFASDLLG